jgi:hypothetical protein
LIQPQLELFDGTGRSIARGESWERSVAGDAAALFSDVGAFPLEPGSTDTALVQTLRPGRYTVQLSGTGNSRGIGLIELYEADDKSDRISNLSSRVFVGPTWLDAAVAGFVIRGTVPKRVLVRVAGPGLAGFSIQDALTNPRLDIRDESGRVWATNDDWEAQTDAASVTAAGTSVGAFPFSRGGRDAALVLTLAPGSYTAVASSADGGSGTALVEVYEVP